ncbi:MAG TPA: hypothetical protein PKW35_16090 [Nannocystaceae bacterium]|nr:hypothetical protein [Nannocystaceae bacterium]
MDARELVIKRRCPVDLGAMGVDRSRPRFFCEHCEQEVVSLSAMRESEARGFVAAMRRRGEGRCVSYAVDAAGKVIFAEAAAEEMAAVVPVSRLRRPLRAAGALLALAACAPHSSPEAEGGEEVLARGRAEAPVVIPEARPGPSAVVADAGKDQEDPAEPEEPVVRAPVLEEPMQPAGRSRGKKKAPPPRVPMDVIDGFID